MTLVNKHNDSGQKKRNSLSKLSREVVWVGVAIVAFLALGLVFNQINPLNEIRLAIEDAQSQAVFEPIIQTPVAIANIPPNEQIVPNLANRPPTEGVWDPEISSDGNWIVFAARPH